MAELKDKVFLDDFAKGNAVEITCNKKLLNKKHMANQPHSFCGAVCINSSQGFNLDR